MDNSIFDKLYIENPSDSVFTVSSGDSENTDETDNDNDSDVTLFPQLDDKNRLSFETKKLYDKNNNEGDETDNDNEEDDEEGEDEDGDEEDDDEKKNIKPKNIVNKDQINDYINNPTKNPIFVSQNKLDNLIKNTENKNDENVVKKVEFLLNKKPQEIEEKTDVIPAKEKSDVDGFPIIDIKEGNEKLDEDSQLLAKELKDLGISIPGFTYNFQKTEPVLQKPEIGQTQHDSQNIQHDVLHIPSDNLQNLSNSVEIDNFSKKNIVKIKTDPEHLESTYDDLLQKNTDNLSKNMDKDNLSQVIRNDNFKDENNLEEKNLDDSMTTLDNLIKEFKQISTITTQNPTYIELQNLLKIIDKISKNKYLYNKYENYISNVIKICTKWIKIRYTIAKLSKIIFKNKIVIKDLENKLKLTNYILRKNINHFNSVQLHNDKIQSTFHHELLKNINKIN